MPAWNLGTIWAPFTEKAPWKQRVKETPTTHKNVVFMRVFGVFLSLNGLLFILCEREKFYYFLFLSSIWPWLFICRPHYEFPDQKLSDLIGNQSLDSDVCSRHEFPDLIFSKPYGKFDTVKVSRSMRHTLYDSSKDIKTVYLGTVFLCAVNIL